MGNVKFYAGANVLSIDGSTTHNYTSIKLNGAELLHGENIKEALDGFVGGTVSAIVQDSDTVDLSGKGTSSDRIRGVISQPLAGENTRGISTISTSHESDDKDKAVAIGALNELRKLAIGYTLKTITVNGNPLDRNIQLTKSTFGLDDVNNTNDMEKSISDEQQTRLDGKSPSSHRHNAGGNFLPLGGLNTIGRLRYVTDKTQSHPQGAAVPNTLYSIATELSNIRNDATRKMPIDAFNIRKWEANGNIVVTNDWTLTFPADAVMFVNQKELKFSDRTVTINEVAGSRTWHAYVYVNGDFPEYQVVANRIIDPNYYYLGEFTSNGSSIVSPVAFDPATSFGDFRELEEHNASPAPHKLSPTPTPADIGLDKIRQNWYLFRNITPATPRAIMNEWDWFSGVPGLEITADNGVEMSYPISCVGGFYIPDNDATMFKQLNEYITDPNFVNSRGIGPWWTVDLEHGHGVYILLGQSNNNILVLATNTGRFHLLTYTSSGVATEWQSTLQLTNLPGYNWNGYGCAVGVHSGELIDNDGLTRKAKFIHFGGYSVGLDFVDITTMNISEFEPNRTVAGNLFDSASTEIKNKIIACFNSSILGLGIHADNTGFGATVHHIDFDIGDEGDAYVSAAAAVDINAAGRQYTVSVVTTTELDFTLPLPPGCSKYIVTNNLPDATLIDGIDIKVVNPRESIVIDPKLARYEGGAVYRGGYKIEADSSSGPLTRTWNRTIYMHAIKSFG